MKFIITVVERQTVALTYSVEAKSAEAAQQGDYTISSLLDEELRFSEVEGAESVEAA